MTPPSRSAILPVGLAAVLLLFSGAAPAQQAAAPLAVDQPTALSPLAGAMRDALGGRDGVAAFYEARDWQPLWTGGDGRPSAALEALIDAVAQAGSHALPAARYDRATLIGLADTLGADAAPGERARLEGSATATFLSFARDITSGALTPREVDREIKIRPPRPDAGRLLTDLTQASDPAAFMAGLAPSDPEYARLRARLTEMVDLARTGGWGASVPAGATLRPGARGNRVAALRARLVAMGDLSQAAAEGDPAVMAESGVASDAGNAPGLSDPLGYDAGLVDAVKRFQARHGLNTDGVVGPATLAAINISADDRARAFAANMERLRWLNRDLGDKRVMVNIAGFMMTFYENGREAFTSRVVVGKPEHQTPEFSDEMEHMVINPSWNVPYSIASEEILPLLRRDPNYLSSKNMKLVGADPFFIDWNAVSSSNFPGRIKQNPGPGNALGRVKFMFPNDNAIYLHDTPAKKLFAKDLRAFSHGCIRLEKPFEFARILLSAQTDDPEATFQRWLANGSERHVQLKEHIPVHISYRTAWIGTDGVPEYRTDIYGRDARIWAALARERVSLGL